MTSDQAPILFIGAECVLNKKTLDMLENKGFPLLFADNDLAVLRAIHANPPACIVMAYPENNDTADRLIRELKSDNIYGHLPVVLLIAREILAAMDWIHCMADDYLVMPVEPADIAARLSLVLARMQRDISANPLTGLPGNISIMNEAERRLALNESFAVAYLDIDHFKAFNDKYGFSRGDEILRMTARILVNAIKSANDKFAYAGHVGGDDFIFITAPECIRSVAQQVCDNFDLIVTNFYDADDRAHGHIESVDREGNPRTFPLMTCSIAIVDTSISAISHLAEISARSAEIKKLAKSIVGSNYIIDRRR